MNKHYLKILIIVLALSVFLIANAALAQDIGTGNNGTVQQIAGQGFFKTDASVANDSFLETFIGQLIAISLGFLGTLFLCFIIYSGIQWMTSGGEEEKIKQAKTRLKNATMGLALIFFSFIIANTVFNFFFQQSGGSQFCQNDNDCHGYEICQNNICAPKACQTDDDCGAYEFICQGTICVQREQPGNVRCEENEDCPDMKPLCQSFLGMDRINIKWCTCDTQRGPACPNGYHCVEKAIGANACE